MSAPKYRYGHGTSKRRPRKILFVVFGSIALLLILAGVVLLDLRKNTDSSIKGESRVVSQVFSDNTQKIDIEEPFYTFELPADWKEIKRNENAMYDNVTWQATAKDKQNRFLTIYVDRIPTDLPINRIVTVRAVGPSLNHNDVSDNCANFTVGGTQDGKIISGSKPIPTKWNKVDFLCNLPQAVDNQVGTGAEGSRNSVTVTGPTKGTHTYFFVYIDRNFQPDYTILYDALSSFSAK